MITFGDLPTGPEQMARRLGHPLPGRVIVVRALPGLGDFLCAVPALRALRAALPDAHITLLGLAHARDLALRYADLLDNFLAFSGFPGILEQPPQVQQFPAFLQEAHSRSFDLALQMHGSGIVSNLYTLLLGAKRTAGFHLPNHFCPDPDSFFPYPEHLSEVRRNLMLLAHLGIPSPGEQLDFPVSADDRAAYAALAARHGLHPGGYVCIHPGAGHDSRRWPTTHFVEAGAALQERGYRLVLTGTAEEAPLGRAISAWLPRPVLDLTGQTTLGVAALLLQNARLLLCNDTGISHLAAAMKTPSVVVFVASSPGRWAPLDLRRHRTVGIGNGTVPTVARVLQAVEELLTGLEEPAYV